MFILMMNITAHSVVAMHFIMIETGAYAPYSTTQQRRKQARRGGITRTEVVEMISLYRDIPPDER